MSDISIAIIGGGIGGLAAARNLLRAGFDVQVYEQVAALREVGAGVQISPNASRVLHGLGLADVLREAGVRPLAAHQRRWDDGRTLLRTPIADDVEREFGFPYYHAYRADILAMLAQSLPAERLHLGHRLMGLRQTGDAVEAEFENGVRISTAALIGADGIHSSVRNLLFEPQAPRFTGCLAYRGLIPAERLKHIDIERSMQIWMGPGKHVVTYFVAGGRFLNFVANTEQDSWPHESWSDKGDPAAMRAAFAGWDPRLEAILAEVTDTFIWGLFDRAPLPQWTHGRVTLLGDACHPMLPYMAQGAAQALEDGVSLTTCLSRYDVPDALARYQALRLPRTAHVQSLAAANKTRFHLPDGPEQIGRDAKMAAGGTDWSIKTIGWLYGYDAAKAVETGDAGLPRGP
jgi:salicylate hydroxylase